MIKETKRLYSLGFAIHLIKPKSKMPVRSGWTTRPKEKWEELLKDYKPGMNVGVRLGQVSKIGDKYLAVIDCDVKSTDPKHLEEMNKKLKTLLKDKTTPCVLSGRGNGSKHFYVLTEVPLTPKRFSQSGEKVKVSMPSVKPSKMELQVLTAEEISRGIRLRPAWEVSLMGEGQQVVLPPSIHPDSGKPYKWFKEVEAASQFLVLDHDSVEGEERVQKQTLNDFKAVGFDLYMSDLPEATVELIVDGKGCEDRSAALFGVTKEMLRHGFTRDQILSCLTDKSLYLGQCAYDHAKTTSRKRAAEWVLNFTFKKAKRDALLEEDFNSEVVEGRVLNEEEVVQQSKELIVKDIDWRKNVKRNQKTFQILSSFHNIKTILCGVMNTNKFVARNEFSIRDLWTVDCPWGSKAERSVSDEDIVLIKAWLSQKFSFEPSVEKISEVITFLSVKNSFHPLRDWLVGLKWDGVKRLDSWLTKYLNATEEPKKYLTIVGRRFLTGMVGRVLQPGVKFDQVLILEGAQGVGKSSAANILAGEEYFSDTELPIGDKDAIGAIQGIWVQELGELAVFSRAENERLKNFISQRQDRARLAYGKRQVDYPRQTVFIGTTNNDEYLKDDSGERRYWPVKVGQVNFDLLREEREQLLAEAVEAFSFGEAINEEGIKEDPKLRSMFDEVKNRRKITDPLEDGIHAFLSSSPDNFNTEKFRMFDLLQSGAPFLAGLKDNRTTQLRIASALKKLGYTKHVTWAENRRAKMWLLNTLEMTPLEQVGKRLKSNFKGSNEG